MEESGQWKGEEGPIRLSYSAWVKRWLQHFRDSSFGKSSAGADPAALNEQRDSSFGKPSAGADPAGLIEQVDSAPRSRLRNRLLLAAGVLVVLILMVLLLFWNYQYIIVWKLLHDQTYTSFPVFGAMDEEEEREKD